MAIRKQEFYEGAALHILARRGSISGIRYEPPWFVLNGRILIHLKYSTRVRSPWSFTFTPNEQRLLYGASSRSKVVIGLICGGDGVAAVPYDDFLSVASPRGSAVHVACYRSHAEHYEISGPDGGLSRKVAPSNWARLLD